MAAVAAAVATTITDGNPTKAQAAVRASKIAQIAREVLALDQGANMALVDVQVIVNSKIAQLDLPPADIFLAQMLTASLGQIIQQQLALTSKGAVSPDTQIAIATVCQWIINDASVYAVSI